jgi:hypothetical protein
MKNLYVIKNKQGIFYYKDPEYTILHREDGPAIEYVNGRKEWYLNGERHREDGPAVEYANEYKAWWLNDNIHRTDGPAVEYSDGRTEWWLFGIRYI